MRKMALHWKIVIGLVLGILAGVAIDQLWSPHTWASLGVDNPAAFMASKPGEPFASGKDQNPQASPVALAVRAASNLNTFIGRLFFRALQFIAVPIVLFSLTVGVASLGDLRRLGRIGAKTLATFVATTAIAIVIGLSLANAVKPGHAVDAATRDSLQQKYRERVAAAETAAQSDVPSFWQQTLDMVPANPFDALARAKMLQVIVIAIVLGAGLTMIPFARAQPVIAVCDAVTEVIVRLVNLIMRLAPLAVFCLVSSAIVQMGLSVMGAVLIYAAVLTAGLALALLVEYPLALWLLARYSPARFFRGLSPALLTAFSSSSSNATLPVTIECTRHRLGVSERIASFVCPLGATINMAGTAMYQGVAAAFIAQMYGHDLTIGQQLTIVLTATLAAIGTPGIPGAGVVMLVIVLESVHIGAEGIAVILGVDRLLDMFRTVVNIAGDAMTAVVVARSEGELDTEPAPVPA